MEAINLKNINLDGVQFVQLNHGGVLHERRVILGLTQKQVAEKAKIPLQSYQRFESAARNLRTASFQIACRVIEALEMNISDYFHFEYFRDENLFDS